MRIFISLFLGLCFINSSAQTPLSEISFPDAKVYNLYGSSVYTSDMDNGSAPIIIFTWSKEWCWPCVNRLDEFAEVYEKWQEETRVQLIAINQDSGEDTKSIADFVKERDWPFEIYHDKDGDFMEATGVSSAPLTLFLNKRKQVVKSYLTYAVTADLFNNILINIDQSTQYLDESLEFSNKEDATFYRITERDYSNMEVPYLRKTFFMDGNIKSIAKMSRIYPVERKEGEYLEYYKDGTIESRHNYINGLENGRRTYYHSNGSIWAEVDYKNDLPWTAISYFSESGSKLDYGTLIRGNGTRKIYNAEGQMSAINNYKLGVLSGMQLRYNTNGSLSSRTYHKDGVRDGLMTIYYEDGVKKGQGTFSEGSLQEGSLIYWDPNGLSIIDHIDAALKGFNINQFFDQIDYDYWDEEEEYDALLEHLEENVLMTVLEDFYEPFDVSDYDYLDIGLFESSEVRRLSATVLKFILIEYYNPISSATDRVVKNIQRRIDVLLDDNSMDVESKMDMLVELLIDDDLEELEENDYDAVDYIFLIYLLEKNHPFINRNLEDFF